MPRKKATRDPGRYTPDDLAAIEQRLNLKLPEDLRRFYLLPDFQEFRKECSEDGVINFSLPTDVQIWKGGLVRRAELPAAWRKARFLAFGSTTFGDALLYCIDGSENQLGRIAVTDHEDDPALKLLGDSLTQWMLRFTEFDGIELAVVPGSRTDFSAAQQVAFARDHLRLNPSAEWAARLVYFDEHPQEPRIIYWDKRECRLRPISEMQSLTDVTLSGIKNGDIRELASLKKLDYLLLSKCGFSDLSPLGGLAKLEWLGIYDAPPLSVAALAPLRKLKQVRTMRTMLHDVGDLAPVASLEFIEITDIPFDDVAGLAKLRGLKKLSLKGTAVRDIRPLAALQELDYLQLDGTPVTNISACLNMPRLESLIISKKGEVRPKALAELRAARPKLRVSEW